MPGEPGDSNFLGPGDYRCFEDSRGGGGGARIPPGKRYRAESQWDAILLKKGFRPFAGALPSAMLRRATALGVLLALLAGETAALDNGWAPPKDLSPLSAITTKLKVLGMRQRLVYNVLKNSRLTRLYGHQYSISVIIIK